MAPITSKLLLLALLSATASAIPTSGCTTTMTLTQSRLPTPPYWPQCSWDGTLSIYPSTVTVTRPVDCSGCVAVRVTETPVVHCPARIISTSVRVATPTTTYLTVCSLTPTPQA